MKLIRPYARWILGAIVTAVAGFGVISWYFAVRFTSPSPRAVGSFAPFLPSATESVRFSASDGVPLAGWYVDGDRRREGIILLHGHWSSRRQMLARAKLLHDQGFGVLLYDARGDGESGGSLMSVGWYETRDLFGAMDYLRRRGYQSFGLLGVSQGAATIALAGSRLHDVKWAVLESTYPTLRDAVDRRFRATFGFGGAIGGLLMVPWAESRIKLSIDAISPIDHVQDLPCPVFILHGAQDRLTLPAAAEALYAKAREPKSIWLVPGAAHNDLYGAAKRDYETRLLAFIATAAVAARRSPAHVTQPTL